MTYDMNINRKEKMRFYNCLTGKKYFPNWEKSFSQRGAYFQGTYVHQLTNLCSSAHEPMFMASRTYVLRFFLFVMMMVVGVNVWGQNTPKVADGIYYISDGTTWWLWPSVSYDDDNATYGTNTGNRFLTSYKAQTATAYTGQNYPYEAHDNTYCHWVVKNLGDDIVQIINPRLNKYMMIRGSHKDCRNGNTITFGDRDVWLADLTEENTNSSKFKLETGVKITVPSTYGSGNGYGFNSAAGLKNDYLASTNKDNANRTERNYRNGLMQLSSGGGYSFTFTSDLLTAPTISEVSASNTITITDANSLPAGYHLRYTFSSEGTPADPTATSDILDVDANNRYLVTTAGTIKVVIERYGVVLTSVASKAVSPVIAAPTVTNNGDGTISLSTATTGATIYYTTNGDTPDNNSTPYSSAFSLGNATVIKAIAYLGSEPSGVTTYNVPQYTTPTISFNSSTSQVTITSSGTVYYTTDGTPPTTSSTSYSTPFSISSAATVKAIATHAGYITSEVATLTITQVATPTIQNNGSNAISITSATDGATIYYTTDGSTPTTSSTEYTGPLTENVSGVTIKAIAVKENMITSAVGSGSVTLKCATPVVTRDGMKFTLSCSMPTDATIYYSLDGSTPTISYSGAVSFTPEQLPLTVTAVAKHAGYSDSDPVTKTLKNGDGTASDPWLIYGATDFANFISDVNAGTTSSDCYKLETDISASGADAITTAFTGTFDGGLHTISDLDHALFNTIDGGTVKNVILDNVNITTGTNVGAIANEVTGTSDNIAAIYNCGILSGSVSGSGYVGGLVGQLGSSTADNCYARVINCYSYANIGSSGTNKGGIVGYNRYASKSNDLRTMVMNCMFYGDIETGGNISPVYGGSKITNRGDISGLNNFNYFRYQSNYSKNGNITSGKYNCALGAEDNYLTRFEFHRNILNSNRELAAWYATGDVSKGKGVGQECEMAKWVLDKSIAPYPILKVQGYYPSVINYDADKGTQPENHGGKLGELTVNIRMGSGGAVFAPPTTGASITESMLTLNITDKDPDNFNYNYRKVQLPYYDRVGTGNCTQNRVVTGWKIVGVSGSGTRGEFTEGSDIGSDGKTPYNFADRTTYAKDLYDESGRVFSQGAYFNVPDGVTGITIEPYWGKAAYLSDPNYDVTYNTGSTATYVTNMGTRYTDGNEANINGHNQVVYTTLANAISGLSSNQSHTVYDYAVVLVGNFHGYYENSSPTGNIQKPLTIMSSDFNKDGEPDYTFFIQHGTNRLEVAPLRYDFINLPGIGLAQKADGLKRSPSMGIYWNNGWFEVTNTAILRMEQMEFNDHKDQDAPLILLGGIYDQIVSFQDDGGKGNWHTPYIYVGDNAWFAMFNNGCYANKAFTTPHVPISVTGGEYEKFYLSGYFRPDATPANDNAECYIDGGKFGELAGSGMEQIKGDVTWKIFNADIDEFYGGGINADKPIQGSIDVNIRNSRVSQYCGGPKFGDMVSGKTVTTNATDCVFDHFYGAGYGGTSLQRVREQELDGQNVTTVTEAEWQGFVTNNYTRQYSSSGISVDYYLEYIQRSGGQGNRKVGRIYIDYASMSLAKTYDVTTNLTGCTVNYNFYGGGHLGAVDGDVTSTLNNCTVYGSAFGAGYSADIPTVEVMPIQFANPNPYYNEDAGVFRSQEDIGYPETVTYTWKQAESVSAGNEFDENGGHFILTEEDLENLGTVTGDVSLTLDGNTVIEGKVFDEDGTVKTDEIGGVFGGGAQSAVNGNITVNLQGNTEVLGNVFGGGDEGIVEGSTEVNIE